MCRCRPSTRIRGVFKDARVIGQPQPSPLVTSGYNICSSPIDEPLVQGLVLKGGVSREIIESVVGTDCPARGHERVVL